jgi:uncharacterized protein (DUF2267 family)
MEELIKLVAEQAGLAPQVAKLAVDAVLAGLKAKLPGPIAAQIDSALGTPPAASGPLGNVMKGLGGLFGGKK